MGHFGRYAAGQKRCQVCAIYIRWDGIWCPCCGLRLRTKPRNSAYKERFAIRTKQQTRKDDQGKRSIIVRY